MTQAQTLTRTPGGQFTKGEVVAETTHHITRESLVRYAGAAGDFNTIHYNDSAAEDAGLPGVLAHGMLTAALALHTVTDWLGGDTTRIRSYETRFTRPVVVDPVAGAHVVVTAKVGKVDTDTLRIDLTVTCEDTTVLGKTQATITFP
ncbi:MaoC/PaaZ C-terminal domain-containing protein [Rhodococcus marinonascens]|uniref:MaoC/PaaZ C-terminal domain-containing protein n=1 Tax=Rhodococcus marinonascens TaxID=38311 RepID=UPI0009339ED4|nr:MaoC/PaaZ C-terminal domain-containing protein [Rhodococcus marinonascens]